MSWPNQGRALWPVAPADELTLARSELSAAHAALDTAGIPRYGKTDFPLPLAQRVRYLVELGPRQGTG